MTPSFTRLHQKNETGQESKHFLSNNLKCMHTLVAIDKSLVAGFLVSSVPGWFTVLSIDKILGTVGTVGTVSSVVVGCLTAVKLRRALLGSQYTPSHQASPQPRSGALPQFPRLLETVEEGHTVILDTLAALPANS